MQDTPQVNPKKLFVGNLPYSTTEQDLSDLFGQYGSIGSVKVVIDRVSGRPRGIAFVEFEEESSASSAVEALNGHELDGRAIIVNVARPQEKRSFSGGSNYNRGGNHGGFNRNNRGYGRNSGGGNY